MIFFLRVVFAVVGVVVVVVVVVVVDVDVDVVGHCQTLRKVLELEKAAVKVRLLQAKICFDSFFLLQFVFLLLNVAQILSASQQHTFK